VEAPGREIPVGAAKSGDTPTSSRSVMDDEPVETGTEPAVPGRVRPPSTDDELQEDPAAQLLVDKRARDLEFTLFYSDQMPRLVTFLIVQGARPAVAAEVAQETMAEAYRSWENIDRPGAWIRTVASRTWWRSIQLDRRETLDLDEQTTVLSAADSEEIENRHAFLEHLSTLPVSQRQVMAWVYDGYQPIEIAALLGKEPATVRSLLRDARAALRKRLRSGEETP
jgi:RNA polymerase sigma factor (sigma-70 family)